MIIYVQLTIHEAHLKHTSGTRQSNGERQPGNSRDSGEMVGSMDLSCKQCTDNIRAIVVNAINTFPLRKFDFKQN